MLPARSAKMVQVSTGEHTFEVMLINEGQTEKIVTQCEAVGAMRDNLKKTEINHLEVKPITAEMVNCGAMCTEEEVKTVTQILNEYRECFAFNLKELGCTNILAMDIVDDGNPVVSKPYRASATERETISKIVQEWKEAGLVTETNSAYASPVLLVTK